MIGRKQEIKKLNQLCESSESKLVTLYGRRRIGKTYLIDYMFKEHRQDCIFFDYTGDYEGSNKIQLQNFKEAIYDWFKVEKDDFDSWTSAFNTLKRVINQEIKDSKHTGKVVLFLDEVPWIDKTNKNGFLSALGHFWNTYCNKQKNVIMILCGSNASWIQNKILDDGIGPHHKRVDEIIALKPFTLEETAQYLSIEKKLELDSKLITEIYMVYGGVAKYLSYYDKDLSFAKNINKTFFSLDGLLYGEYETLFKSLFQDKATTYKILIDILCQKRSGYTAVEVAQKAKLSPTSPSFRKAMDELVTCGFITAVNRLNNERNSKYIIADPFCLFYNRWVKPLSKNQIARLNNYWDDILEDDRYPKWTGYSFEMVCILNIDLYLKQRGMSGVYKGVSYWSYRKNKDSDINDKGAQIDLLVEYKGGTYDIVECKYSNDIYKIESTENSKILNKKKMFIKHGLKNQKYDIKTVMLTTYGTVKNSYYNNIPINDDITLEALLGY